MQKQEAMLSLVRNQSGGKKFHRMKSPCAYNGYTLFFYGQTYVIGLIS